MSLPRHLSLHLSLPSVTLPRHPSRPFCKDLERSRKYLGTHGDRHMTIVRTAQQPAFSQLRALSKHFDTPRGRVDQAFWQTTARLCPTLVLTPSKGVRNADRPEAAGGAPCARTHARGGGRARGREPPDDLQLGARQIPPRRPRMFDSLRAR